MPRNGADVAGSIPSDSVVKVVVFLLDCNRHVVELVSIYNHCFNDTGLRTE